MAVKTYSVYFRATDTGLTPSFVKFTRRSDNVNLLGSAPAVSEVLGPGGSFGEYKFSFDATVEIAFVVDGGAGIALPADRYVRGVIGPEDSRLDMAVGTARDDIRGAQSLSISTIAGAATFVPGTDDLHQIRTNASAPSAATVAAAVANEALAGHTTAGTLGKVLSDLGTNVVALKKYEEGRWKIHTNGVDVNRLVLYDSDGTTPILKFDLKDASGTGAFVNPFERVPA